MTATRKEMADLDSFVKSVSSAVDKFQCFGAHNSGNPCVYCNVRKMCKAQTPKGATA